MERDKDKENNRNGEKEREKEKYAYGGIVARFFEGPSINPVRRFLHMESHLSDFSDNSLTNPPPLPLSHFTHTGASPGHPYSHPPRPVSLAPS